MRSTRFMRSRPLRRIASGRFSPQPASSEGGDGAPARVLILGNDPATTEMMAGLTGCSVVSARSVDEGLAALSASAYDLVILEASVVGADASDACARIRQRQDPTPLILLLAEAAHGRAATMGAVAGADDVLEKPLDAAMLALRMRALLRLKSLEDQVARTQAGAEAPARMLALLDEIGRNWSLTGGAEEFTRTVTRSVADLTGAPVSMIAVYHRETETIAASLPAHGLPDEVAGRFRLDVTAESRAAWRFDLGRASVSNDAGSDPRLPQAVVAAASIESLIAVPLISEGQMLGLLVAANKPGGFTEADAEVATHLARPAATFLQSRRILENQRTHAARLEKLSTLVRDMAAILGRTPLLYLTVPRIQADMGYERVAFYEPTAAGGLALAFESGAERPPQAPLPAELLEAALAGTSPVQVIHRGGVLELAVAVRAAEQAVGVLDVLKSPGSPFPEEEVSLLSTLAGQLALALQRSAIVLETERLAEKMATLYHLVLETASLQDLRQLFHKFSEEAGRLIKADHTSVFRFDDADQTLRLFAAWTRDPSGETYADPVFRLGEGIAGRVARDWVPIMLEEAHQHRAFVPKGNAIAGLLCVPLTYYDQEQGGPVLFGVLNASRRPGRPCFGEDDFEYMTRFAGQLSIAVANSMAFAAERGRSEQLALVNRLMREIAGNLSREHILETSVRRIQEAFRLSAVMIGVPDLDTGTVRTGAAAGSDPTFLADHEYPLDEGVMGRAIRLKRTALAADVSEVPSPSRILASTASELAIPILSADEVTAVLKVESDRPRAFNHAQVITLETLADGIGIILRNAELYRALERTNAKLVELGRLKSEVLNIVAHDFRAPLSGVLGYAELLEWKPDAAREDRVEHARAIIRAAGHMSKLVDKTLTTTRLETGHFPFEFAVTDLGSVVRGVIERLPQDAAHPVVVEVPEDPVACWADRDRISEVLENLLSNAVKYSPDGGSVRIEVGVESENATVRVSDQGIGVDQADLERLFRPFSRVRTAQTAKIEGSGLGLYICDRIVNAHGGRLWVKSEPGRGSVFAFSLPIFGIAAQSREPLLLVAAGDPGTRREVGRVAEELGYRVHEVADGVDAVESCLRLRPAAAVLDRILPGLSAEEVTERLRQASATAALPVFVLASPEELGGGASLFRGCIRKPLDRLALTSALGAVLTTTA